MGIKIRHKGLWTPSPISPLIHISLKYLCSITFSIVHSTFLTTIQDTFHYSRIPIYPYLLLLPHIYKWII